MKKELTVEEKIYRLDRKVIKLHSWLARHIHKEDLPLSINLNLRPEAMTIIHERLKHG
jgi:hypothetical protein